MQIGLNLDTQVPVGANAESRFRDLVVQAQCASDEGFGIITCGQHYLPDTVGMFQPWPVLAAISQVVPQVELATGIVLAPLDNPVRLAEMAASLDVLSGGRFILGVGAGYRDIEFRAFGVENQPLALTADLIQIVRDLLRGREVTVDFPWCKLDNAQLTMLPVRDELPIWMAANSDKAVKAAAEVGDAWLINPHARIGGIARQFDLYSSVADPIPGARVPLMREVFCAPTSLEAKESAWPFLKKKYELYVKWGQSRVQPRDDQLDLPFDDLVADRFIVGNPAECLEQILAIRSRIPITDLIMRFQWVGLSQDSALRSIRLLGRAFAAL